MAPVAVVAERAACSNFSGTLRWGIGHPFQNAARSRPSVVFGVIELAWRPNS